MTLRDQIRELHEPVGTSYLRCDGCDVDGWEGEQPEWPCSTAKLVYTLEEIADILAAAEAEVAKRRPAPIPMVGPGYSPDLDAVARNRAEQLEHVVAGIRELYGLTPQSDGTTPLARAAHEATRPVPYFKMWSVPVKDVEYNFHKPTYFPNA